MEEKLKDLIAIGDDYLYKVGQWFTKIASAFGKAYTSNSLEKPLIILSFTWAILALLVVLYIFIRFDLEHRPRVEKTKSFTFFSDNNPAEVEFTLRGKLTEKSFLCYLMLLFYKKGLIFTNEELATGKGEHNVVKKNQTAMVESLTLDEERFQKKLLLGIGQNNEIPFRRIKEISKYPDTMQNFVNVYYEWKYNAKNSIRISDYYENIGAAFGGVYLFLIIGIVICILTIKYTNIAIAFIALFVLIFVYMFRVSKRTYKCTDNRARWLMFKKNLNQFNSLDIKDMPNPKLWAKYYAYSIVLGCENEVYKMIMSKEGKDINMDGENNYDEYFELIRTQRKVYTNFKYALEISKSRKGSTVKF